MTDSYSTFSSQSSINKSEYSGVKKVLLVLQEKIGLINFVVNCILLFIFFAVFVYGSVIQFFVLPELLMVLYIIMPICLIFFCFSHSMYSFGWKLSLIFLGLTIVLTYFFELFGVQTGILYGKYSYSKLIPAHMLSVPIEIPFSWYMMLYPSFCVADDIISGKPHTRKLERLPIKTLVVKRIFLVLLTSIIMIGWDLGADPMGSTHSSIWIWKNNDGMYFGVPLLNFFGWFITVFTIIFAFLLIEHFLPGFRIAPSYKKLGPCVFSTLPLIAYFGMTLFYVIFGYPSEICIITAFSMGVPLLLAIIRLLLTKFSHPTQSSSVELLDNA
eukprot:TRINITY_DN1006_c0_g1_i1.p1 TRINITY_DN1006_c0_g1~~TRINITY_DN1006_c0_g1_i1.p1  ORF type:complete len:338 (-),score=46.28 TRINITY_DN1006_c0_g1_i1:16-999(-)